MKKCPRCEAPDCSDPDSKGCSDNCIMLMRKRLEEADKEYADETGFLHGEITKLETANVELMKGKPVGEIIGSMTITAQEKELKRLREHSAVLENSLAACRVAYKEGIARAEEKTEELAEVLRPFSLFASAVERMMPDWERNLMKSVVKFEHQSIGPGPFMGARDVLKKHVWKD